MKKKSLLALFCTLVVILSGVALFSAFAEPGDTTDPLITKSYIDGVIGKLTQRTSYKLISMKNGQHLVCAEGAEMIIRQGTGIVFAGANGGLADVTDGIDLIGGSYIPGNHLIVCPVSDWRGFKAVGNVLVLVRGDAQVVD